MYTYQRTPMGNPYRKSLYSGFVRGYNPQESSQEHNTYHSHISRDSYGNSMGVPLAGDMRSGRGKRGKGRWLSGIS